LRIACAVGLNSRDSSSGLRPDWTNSTICRQNSGGYALLDTDLQRTASHWVDRRNALNGLATVHCAERHGNVFHALRDLVKRYDEVVVDAGGRDSEELRGLGRRP
jgi:hypothetical protein